MVLGHRVIQVACGSRDAQTLALSDEGNSAIFFVFGFKCSDMLYALTQVTVVRAGLVFSWGDGDFGKLGRGGSEGCNIPQNIERLNGQGVCQIECGAQFSLALTKTGVVWTWYASIRETPGKLARPVRKKIIECLSWQGHLKALTLCFVFICTGARETTFGLAMGLTSMFASRR